MTENVRAYTTVDKAHWSRGAWDDECDKMQWIDDVTDLDCLIVRNHAGALCGYVGVPASHPWFGVDYSECTQPQCTSEWRHCEHAPEALVHVHGGLTFSDVRHEGSDPAHGICHVPFAGRPDLVWWFGWDAAHAGDLIPGYQHYGSVFVSDVYRDIAYAREQCASLARQLADVAR